MKNFNFFDIVSPFFDKIVPGAKKSFDIIEKNCNIKVADKILDLGGGSGRIASFFINKAREITVVDSSRGMIKQCEKRKGINCILADAENLPFRDGYFDKIIIVDALHHFHNQESVIREVARVLKKEGKLVIEEFNPEKIIGRLIEFFEEILNSVHVRNLSIFSRQTLRVFVYNIPSKMLHNYLTRKYHRVTYG